MSQPSLFSADLTGPELSDLGGLLAAHGHAVGGAGGTRLSILLADRWRAAALAMDCEARGVACEIVEAPRFPDQAHSAGYDASRGTVLLRTERTTRLGPLSAAWTKGAVKAVPAGLTATPGLLRLWALAAGSDTEAGYELGLDPHAPGTHDGLAGALGRCGIPAIVVGRASPMARITGVKRRRRLAEMLGARPDGVPAAAFPAT